MVFDRHVYRVSLLLEKQVILYLIVRRQKSNTLSSVVWLFDKAHITVLYANIAVLPIRNQASLRWGVSREWFVRYKWWDRCELLRYGHVSIWVSIVIYQTGSIFIFSKVRYIWVSSCQHVVVKARQSFDTLPLHPSLFPSTPISNQKQYDGNVLTSPVFVTVERLLPWNIKFE